MKPFNITEHEPKKSGPSQLGKTQSVKSRVNRHEKALADKLEGFRQPASGALAGHKGDIKLDDFLLDSKETDAGALGITSRDIVKICREAFGEGKDPALVLTWNKIAETVPSEWVLIPLNVFNRLIQLEKERGSH